VEECHWPDDLEAHPRTIRVLNPTTHEILRQRWLAGAAAPFPPLVPERSDFLEGDAPAAEKVAFVARALEGTGGRAPAITAALSSAKRRTPRWRPGGSRSILRDARASEPVA
jgi:hypothetical protein